MSLGKGGKNKAQTQTQSLPDWVQPYAQNYLKSASDAASKPYQAYNGQTVAGFDPFQSQAINQQAQMAGSNPVYGGASDQMQKTIAGDYLNSNPYLQANIDAAQGDVIRNYNLIAKPAADAAGVRSGSFGNSGLAQMQGEQERNLVGELGRISSSMRGQNYANERQNQMSAIGQAPQFAAARYNDAQMLANAGAMNQQQNQRVLDDQYNRFAEERDYPLKQLQVMGGALGNMNYGGTTTSTGGGGSNGLAQGLGGLLSLASMFNKQG